MRNLRDQETYNDVRREELRRDIQVARDNNNAVGGLLLLVSLIALGLGAFAWMANRQADNPAPRNNTIIERTREVVPVPQPQAPQPVNPPSIQPPDIQINVPDPAPSNNTAPSQSAPDPAPAPNNSNPAPANP